MTQKAPSLVNCGAVRIVRTLQAQGFPIPWQERRVGADLAHLTIFPDDDLIDADTLTRLRRLAARCGERMAVPDHMLTTAQITAARAEARRDGWYPSCAYDEDGNLDPRALPEHPWAVIDEVCARRLRVAAAIVAHPHARGGRIADDVGVSRRSVARSRARANRLTAQDPGWVRKATDLVGAWERCDTPATLAALRLGLIDAETVPPDHPDLAAFRHGERLAVTA